MDIARDELQDILNNAVKKEIRVRWRSTVRSFGHGERRSVHRGHGDDFDSHRDYEFGDDVRRISWRVLAGLDQLVVKEFKPPTQLNGFVITDVSNTLDYGTVRVTKRRLAAELAASCVLSLSKTKDRAGLMYFSTAGFNPAEDYIRPLTASVRQAYVAAAATMTKRQPAMVAGTTASTGGLAGALKHLPFKRSLVFIISDFQHLTESDWTVLHDVGRMHDVICLYVQDERERELPEPVPARGFGGRLRHLFDLDGYILPLEDFNGNRRYIWNTRKNRELYAANFRALEASITTRMKECNCRWLIVSTEQGPAAWPRLIEVFG